MRFSLSYRDLEDLVAEHGLDISYETARQWVARFGPLNVRELWRRVYDTFNVERYLISRRTLNPFRAATVKHRGTAISA